MVSCKYVRCCKLPRVCFCQNWQNRTTSDRATTNKGGDVYSKCMIS